MNKKLSTIIASALLLVAAVAIEHTLCLPVWQMLLIYLVPYLVAGHEVIAEAAESVAEGKPFNEDFLMSLATIGALAIGFLPGAETQFAEAVFVMLFFQVGELFEDYAEDKSRASIAQLMDIRPDTANVERDGSVLTVSPAQVAVGETIVVRPGERVPLDGVIVEGTTSLDTAALTGESLPRDVAPGDAATSGCINLSGVVRVKVEKPYESSTVAQIIDLIENAAENKSRSETFISRFARVYTPVVVMLAVAIAVLPPLVAAVGHVSAIDGRVSVWLYRALTFLVVSCPCALVISVPLSFFGGIGGASRHGILIKGASFVDSLAATGTVVFDKTGTLTRGQFEVCAVHPDAIDARQLLHLASHVERFSTHPIAMSLKNAWPDEADQCTVADIDEMAGMGISATVNGRVVCVGNERMMEHVGAAWRPCHTAGTTVHVSIDGTYAGHIVVSDRPKADARQAVSSLKALGVRRTVMLTGDRQEMALSTQQATGIDEVHSQLLPADKVAHVERLLAECHADGRRLAFVGDGINDAPVLARADVGIAMGALGADAAIEAADVVLMDDKPSKVATAIAIARRTVGIAHQNVAFAIGVKVAVLVMAALGVATMWMAVFADVGVTVLAVLNAMRTLRA